MANLRSLREDIEALSTWPKETTGQDLLVRDHVLALIDHHKAQVVAQLRMLKADDDLPLDRRMGYSLALDDVLGIITGRIKCEPKPQDNVSSRGEERPAREQLRQWEKFDSKAGVEVAYTLAIVEAIDALGERLDHANDKLDLTLTHALSAFEGVLMRNPR